MWNTRNLANEALARLARYRRLLRALPCLAYGRTANPSFLGGDLPQQNESQREKEADARPQQPDARPQPVRAEGDLGHVVRVRCANDLTVDDHVRSKEHANVEQGVDAGLRRNEVYDEDGQPFRWNDGNDKASGSAYIGSVESKVILDPKLCREGEHDPQDRQDGASAVARLPDKKQDGTKKRGAHVSGRVNSSAGSWADAVLRLGDPAGVLEDLQMLKTRAREQHHCTMGELMEPGGQKLERVEHDAAEGKVPKQERGQESQNERTLPLIPDTLH